MEIEDLVYSLERFENIPEMAEVWEQIDSITSNGNVMTVKLKNANNSFMRELAEIPVLNKSYCESVGDRYANEPVGTGPYKLAEYVPGERVVLEAWADYPFEKAKIAKITYKGISEASARYMAVEAGDAQFSPVAYADYQRAESNEKIATFEGPTTSTSFVSMNTTAAPFDNTDVRLAMAYAYNKEGYKDLATTNNFTIDSMFIDGSEYYYSSDYAISYDLGKAKELLEKAGYNESNPLEFIVALYGGDNPIMQAYQADLISIGVNVTLENYEFGTFLNLMMNQEYQMLIGSWGNVTGDPLSSAACYWSGSFGSMNIAFYQNDRCDELYETALVSTDKNEILECCKELQDIAWQEVPIFPTYGRYQNFAYDKNLSDMVISPSGIISFRTAVYAG
jgi:peptide/nickel transport system substrate-binding protein